MLRTEMPRATATILTLLLLLPTLGFASGAHIRDAAQEANSSPGKAASQNPVIASLIADAERSFQAGELANQAGSFSEARRKFDRAVDLILESGLSTREHPELREYLESLVNRIHAIEELALASGQAVPQQTYEPPPLEQLADIDLNKEAVPPADPQENIGVELDFVYTPTAEVKQFINYFTRGRGRSTMETGLRRAGRYLTGAQKIFREEGVPLDLVWLAQAESNWRPEARSWANAQGIWQFVPYTGKKYGLSQTGWVDERSGIEQPARAAARYLKWLYNRYLDWQLAMAAYNCGEGSVDRAIAVSGYSDFWYLHRSSLLPRETQNYVPIILAIIIIAKNPEKYGLEGVVPEPPLEYDRAKIRGSVDLRLVSEIVNSPFEKVQELNPELKRGVTPPETEFQLRLPPGTGSLFEQLINRIPVSRRDSWRVHTLGEGETIAAIADRHELSVQEISEVNEIESAAVLPTGHKLILPVRMARTPYKGGMVNWNSSQVVVASRRVRGQRITVRPGDTITRIAARYGMSAREIARLNHLQPNSRLQSGQQIVLNLPKSQSRETVRRESAGVSKGKSLRTVRTSQRKINHRVKSGESLTRIASRYGVSVSDLKRWNRISGNNIHRGQRLTIHASR